MPATIEALKASTSGSVRGSLSFVNITMPMQLVKTVAVGVAHLVLEGT